MNDQLPQVKALNKEINKIVNNNFQVVTDDTAIENNITSTWDDLISLKNSIAEQIMQFVGSVQAISSNAQLIALIEDKEHFNKLLRVFFQDVNDYTAKFKDLRLQHEHRTGKISSIEEFEQFNKLAFTYYALSEELLTVITPVVTDIIVISNADVMAEMNKVQPNGDNND